MPMSARSAWIFCAFVLRLIPANVKSGYSRVTSKPSAYPASSINARARSRSRSSAWSWPNAPERPIHMLVPGVTLPSQRLRKPS